MGNPIWAITDGEGRVYGVTETKEQAEALAALFRDSTLCVEELPSLAPEVHAMTREGRQPMCVDFYLHPTGRVEVRCGEPFADGSFRVSEEGFWGHGAGSYRGWFRSKQEAIDKALAAWPARAAHILPPDGKTIHVLRPKDGSKSWIVYGDRVNGDTVYGDAEFARRCWETNPARPFLDLVAVEIEPPVVVE